VLTTIAANQLLEHLDWKPQAQRFPFLQFFLGGRTDPCSIRIELSVDFAENALIPLTDMRLHRMDDAAQVELVTVRIKQRYRLEYIMTKLSAVCAQHSAGI
jgi:hypothetical protein